jgi:hypothetical protein
MADTGAVSPGTGANDAAIGSVAWNNPENIVSSNNSYANTSAFGSLTTNYIKGTNFGLTVPTGATIDGIEVTIERATSGFGAGTDNIVRLIKGGTIGGTNKAVGGNWGSSETPQSYGGPTDLWGNAWTAEDVNDASFGIAMSGSLSGDPDDGMGARVDHMTIKVYYTGGAPTVGKINLGNVTINKIFLGGTEVKKVYLGATAVHSKV